MKQESRSGPGPQSKCGIDCEAGIEESVMDPQLPAFGRVERYVVFQHDAALGEQRWKAWASDDVLGRDSRHAGMGSASSQGRIDLLEPGNELGIDEEQQELLSCRRISVERRTGKTHFVGNPVEREAGSDGIEQCRDRAENLVEALRTVKWRSGAKHEII